MDNKCTEKADAVEEEDSINWLDYNSDVPIKVQMKFAELLKENPGGILLTHLDKLYAKKYGNSINVYDYNVLSITELVSILPSIFRLVSLKEGNYMLFFAYMKMGLHERELRKVKLDLTPEHVKDKIRRLLCKTESVHVNDFLSLYKKTYEQNINFSDFGLSGLEAFIKKYDGAFFERRTVNGIDVLFTKPLECDAENREKQYDLFCLQKMDRNNFPSDYISPHEMLPSLDYSAELKIGETIPVVVSSATNCHNFYITLKKYWGELDELMDKIGEFYDNKTDEQKIPEWAAVSGVFCAAYFKKDGYHRVQIDRPTLSGAVRCYYVDYGYFWNLKKENLYYLHKKFSHFPRQAIFATLALAEPIGADWTVKVSNRFGLLTAEPNITAKILQVNTSVGRATVSLMVDGVDILDILVKEGLARRSPPDDYDSEGELFEVDEENLHCYLTEAEEDLLSFNQENQDLLECKEMPPAPVRSNETGVLPPNDLQNTPLTTLQTLTTSNDTGVFPPPNTQNIPLTTLPTFTTPPPSTQFTHAQRPITYQLPPYQYFQPRLAHTHITHPISAPPFVPSILPYSYPAYMPWSLGSPQPTIPSAASPQFMRPPPGFQGHPPIIQPYQMYPDSNWLTHFGQSFANGPGYYPQRPHNPHAPFVPPRPIIQNYNQPPDDQPTVNTPSFHLSGSVPQPFEDNKPECRALLASGDSKIISQENHSPVVLTDAITEIEWTPLRMKCEDEYGDALVIPVPPQEFGSEPATSPKSSLSLSNESLGKSVDNPSDSVIPKTTLQNDTFIPPDVTTRKLYSTSKVEFPNISPSSPAKASPPLTKNNIPSAIATVTVYGRTLHKVLLSGRPHLIVEEVMQQLTDIKDRETLEETITKQNRGTFIEHTPSREQYPLLYRALELKRVPGFEKSSQQKLHLMPLEELARFLFVIDMAPRKQIEELYNFITTHSRLCDLHPTRENFIGKSFLIFLETIF